MPYAGGGKGTCPSLLPVARIKRIAYAAGGKGTRPSVAPVARMKRIAYAAGGKGRPRPLHPRPGAFAPWNPKMMHPNGEYLTHMPP